MKIKESCYSFSFLSQMYSSIINCHFKCLGIYSYHNCSKFLQYHQKLTKSPCCCSFAIHTTDPISIDSQAKYNYGTSLSVLINYSLSFTSWNPWVLLLYRFWKWSLININNVITFWNEFKNPSSKYGLNILELKILTQHRSWWTSFEWIL